MASNMPRTATTFSSPSGSVVGIEKRAIARIVRAVSRHPELRGWPGWPPPRLRCGAVRAHFRIFGIPVRVEPFFIIVAFLFGINLPRVYPLWVLFAFVGIVFVSVLVHELGHALTYRLLGQRAAIVLQGFGGFTVATGGGRRVMTKAKSVMASTSGAFFQLLLLGVPFYAVARGDAGQRELVHWVNAGLHSVSWWPIAYYLGRVSIWWAIFNLLPIRPLDGGHVAETLVGFDMACKLSIAAAAIAGFVVFRYSEFGIWGLLFFGFYAYVNYRDMREGQSSGTFDVDAPEGTPASGGRSGRGRRVRRGGNPNLAVVPNAES